MNEKKLYILWTNSDLFTSQHMVMMYATNSMLHGWWDAVTVIIWGSTAKLVSENKDIQTSMEMAVHAGVHFSACISCARQLGVHQELLDLGIEVIPWGLPLTRILQEENHLITI